MSVRRLAALLLAGFLAPTPARGQAAPDPQRPDLNRSAQQVIDRTNRFRQDQKWDTVTVNPKLMETAKDFADFMARTDLYGHEADGRDPAGRAKQHGYDDCLVAENIAYAFSSAGFTTEGLARQLVEGWENSPPHRKNLLDADVTETGVAVARSADTGLYYAVQVFGRPKALAVEFRIANRAGVPVRYTVGEQSFDLQPQTVMTHQLCRPEDVTFHWPGESGAAAKGAQTIRPANGERYVVVRSSAGALSVQKE
jgi:uncharacterized protein YkwD